MKVLKNRPCNIPSDFESLRQELRRLPFDSRIFYGARLKELLGKEIIVELMRLDVDFSPTFDEDPRVPATLVHFKFEGGDYNLLLRFQHGVIDGHEGESHDGNTDHWWVTLSDYNGME